jgi:hypothetical protein
MGSLIIFLVAVTFSLIGFLVLHIKTMSTKDLQIREMISADRRRIEAYALRERRRRTGKRCVSPSDLIGEYIDSLLGHQSVIAGTATQIEHWTKARQTPSPKAYPCCTPIVTLSIDEDWIQLEDEATPAKLKAAS